MNELTTITQSQTMSSLQIAELTGKKHSNVMRDIRKMAENLNQFTSESVGSEYHRGDRTQYKYLSERAQNALLDFAIGKNASQYIITETSYTDTKGEKRAMYSLNKKACFLLASGYDVVLRAKIIDRWEELETANANQYQVPTSFREALLLAAAQQEQIEEQQKLLLAQGEQIAEKDRAIAELHERTSYLDQILNSKNTVTTTQIAQDYGMSASKFNKLLTSLKIQRKVGGQWILYAPHNTMGYVHSDTFIPENSTTGKVVMVTKWLQKGRLFLYEILKKNNVLPLIER